MKLASVNYAGTAYAAIQEDEGLNLLAYTDLKALLTAGVDLAELETVKTVSIDDELLDYLPIIPEPSKIICVGQNYLKHIEELGHTPPKFPTLFAKFATALIGPYDQIIHPDESDRLDWEAELTIVIGKKGRKATAEQAAGMIAGYTITNEITARDWQRRTQQWLQGKTWDNTTPVGPVMVTVDELGLAPAVGIRTRIDGVTVQDSVTSDMLFKPVEIVQYITKFTTLNPGDIILTGTPSGVGEGRDPKIFLQPGQVIETEIDGIGMLRNLVVADNS